AKGVLAGAAGIITKPVEGAERGGVTGFLGGLAKGLVGAAVNPVSGALAAVSKVTEGFDATRRNLTGVVTGVRRQGVGRKRLQRAFTGDNVLRPFNLHTALGQALLHSVAAWMSPGGAAAAAGRGAAVAAAGSDPRVGYAGGGSSGLLGLGAGLPLVGALPSVRGAVGSRPDLRRDRYEQHWLLPGAVVLMITDRRVLAMRAPEFCTLQERALAGDVAHVTDVPSNDAVVLWQLPWPELLSAELAWFQKDSDKALTIGSGSSARLRQYGAKPHQDLSAEAYGDMYGPSSSGGRKVPPDGLMMHRKDKLEDDRLLYEVHCIPGSFIATEIRNRLQEVRYRCYLLPRQQERGWRDSQPPAAVAAAAQLPAAAAALHLCCPPRRRQRRRRRQGDPPPPVAH
ncbi:hypothetical protein Vafri_19599, partial [Volvox africanus]